MTRVIQTPVRSLLDDEMVRRLATSLVDRLPWLVLLPDDLRVACSRDLLDVARASAEVGHYHLLHSRLAAWKATVDAIARGIPADKSDLEWLDESEVVENPAR